MIGVIGRSTYAIWCMTWVIALLHFAWLDAILQKCSSFKQRHHRTSLAHPLANWATAYKQSMPHFIQADSTKPPN